MSLNLVLKYQKVQGAGCKVLGAKQREATIPRQRKGCMVQGARSSKHSDDSATAEIATIQLQRKGYRVFNCQPVLIDHGLSRSLHGLQDRSPFSGLRSPVSAFRLPTSSYEMSKNY